MFGDSRQRARLRRVVTVVAVAATCAIVALASGGRDFPDRIWMRTNGAPTPLIVEPVAYLDPDASPLQDFDVVVVGRDALLSTEPPLMKRLFFRLFGREPEPATETYEVTDHRELSEAEHWAELRPARSR